MAVGEALAEERGGGDAGVLGVHGVAAGNGGVGDGGVGQRGGIAVGEGSGHGEGSGVGEGRGEDGRGGDGDVATAVVEVGRRGVLLHVSAGLVRGDLKGGVIKRVINGVIKRVMGGVIKG